MRKTIQSIQQTNTIKHIKKISESVEVKVNDLFFWKVSWLKK